MRVGILGPLEVWVDGEIVEFGGVRLRTLLIRLALDAGRVVTAESLSEALWPEDGPAEQAHALQSLVSRLRRALPGKSAVRSAPGGYRLDLPPDSVDAVRFERLAREGRRALTDGEPELAAARLREALGLWRGAALGEVAGIPFAVAAAVRLEELRLTAIEDRVAAELETGAEPSYLVAELEELSAEHPLRERLRLLLMKALYAAGRRAEALNAHAEFRRLLADELGTDPGPELQDMHLAVLRGERVAPRPSGTPQSHGNLRAPLTSFVGRTEERIRIAKRLTEGRLVTLVGPGGAGKTRLATTVAAEIAADVPGGVWLVELAPLTDPGDVPQAVIGALGLRESGLLDAPAAPRDPTSRLTEALSATETLIVLDNCEHLIDAAARLVDDLLGRCPRLRVLATSREPLGILGEALCPVPPLASPAPGVSTTEAVGSPAVRLFADRAAAVRPDFTVTDDNVAAVIEICRRLDGLPLTIELAAARLRSLPIGQLAARLADRFQLLTGSRTALPRHQTLRAVVAWSWQLLDDDERRLARRLAVFPATITPEAAGQVCGLTRSVPTEILDLLSALVDKSLLQLVPGAEPRYRMLETIREYGLEQLAETGEIAQVRAAHAAYFLDLAERAEPHLRGPDQLPWIARLTAERDDLPAALHFACDAGDAENAVRIAAALSMFWTIHGNHAETASRLRLALDVPGQAPPEATTVATVFYLINAVLSGGHVHAETVVEGLRTRVRGAESGGARNGRANGCEHDAYRTAGHPVSALIEPAFALFTDDIASGLAAIDRQVPHPDPWTRAMLRLMRALLTGNSGDMGGMRRDLAAAVTAFREAGERWGLGHSLTYLAYTHTTLGDFDAAVDALEESVRLLREVDSGEDAVQQRVMLAEARAQQGDAGRARDELLVMVEPGAGTPSAGYLVLARITLGNLARHDGDLDEAARHYDAAADLSRVPSQTPHVSVVLNSAMAHLAVVKGDAEAARRHLTGALALAVEPPDMSLAAVVGVGVARLTARHGTAHTAAEVLGAAHALRGAPDAFNPDVVRLALDLREALGERAHEAAYARGCRLDRGGALALIETQLRPR